MLNPFKYLKLNEIKTWFFLGIFLSVFILIVFGLLSYREVNRILSTKPTSWTKDHRADCGVVLTGGSYRVREGLDLLTQKNIRKLIISGIYQTTTLDDIFPEIPFYGDIRVEDIVLENMSETTYGNAKKVFVLAEELDCSDIVLITSRLHMYRAYRTFRAVFPKDYKIQQRAVISGNLRPNKLNILYEVASSILYRPLWLL